ncbi:hypothetical protein [Acinetobacter wuhouensis]|uniref:hypothetical protein n=1 Tax=Acinetobacter wuhouensis TaxID=1879050 RepID=UPI0013EE601D|nr:hypothetical protein [Acinetobacter wuhouensis]
MTREEFRANLYQTYVSAGMYDPVLIQEYIQIAESFVFDKLKFTQNDLKALSERMAIEN